MHAAAGPRDVRVPATHDRHALVYHNEPSRRGRRRDCCMDVNRSTRSGIGSPTACGRQNVDAVRLVPVYESQSREEAIKLCKPADESSNSQRPSYSRRGRHWRRLAFASTLPHPTLPQPTFAKPTTFISRIYVQHSVQRVQGPDRPDRPLSKDHDSSHFLLCCHQRMAML